MRSHVGREAGSRGAAAVEFAIVVPLLLLILFALVDFGRLFFVEVSLNAASREGARASALHRSTAQVIQVVQDSSPGTATISSLGEASLFTVLPGAGCPANPGPTDMTTVGVQVPFRWLTPLGFIGLVNPGESPSGTDFGVGRVLQSESRMLCVG